MRRLARTWALASLGLPLVFHFACVGSDPEIAQSSGEPDGGLGGADGSSGDAAPPASGPASLRFHNQEFRDGFAEGRVKIAKADDETGVAEYVVYWGTSETVKAPGDPIAVLPRGPAELVFTLATGTPIPPGATHLLALTRNEKGEGPSVAAPIANDPVFVDATARVADAGVALDTGDPRALVDETRQRLLVVGKTASPEGRALGTLACKLDVSECSFAYACVEDDCAGDAKPALDDANGKLLIGAYADYNVLAGYVCEPDGSGCQKRTEPGSGQPSGSGAFAWPFVRANDVLVLNLSQDATNDGHLLATVCDASFTTCPAKGVVLEPSVARATAISAAALPNGRIAVAASADVSAGGPSLTLYVTDGTVEGTTYEIASLPAKSGTSPAIAVDTRSERIVIVTTDATDAGESRLLLTRCSYAGVDCTSIPIGVDSPPGSGHSPAVAVDLENEKLLVVSSDLSNGGKPLLTRCNLDGTRCRTRELSGGEAYPAGQPSVAIDPVNGYLLTVTNPTGKIGVIRWGI